jgi:hypothetical protein
MNERKPQRKLRKRPKRLKPLKRARRRKKQDTPAVVLILPKNRKRLSRLY